MPETTLSQLTAHVYWMSPGAPDRPSLAAVVGSEYTLMLDAGASAAHARLFLESLQAESIKPPGLAALTHWHWDHILGAHELNIPVIAHRLTAEQIAVQAGYDWHDAALDQRVAAGLEIAFCADNIKLELPEPREVRLVKPHIIFTDSLELHMGEVSVHLRHVGGDHAPDSVVMHILPDRVLFLGDCLYDAIYTPVRHYTPQRLLSLLDTILSFDAAYFIEGHTPTVLSRDELLGLADNMRMVAAIVQREGGNRERTAQAVQAQTGRPLDEELRSLIETLTVGYGLAAAGHESNKGSSDSQSD